MVIWKEALPKNTFTYLCLLKDLPKSTRLQIRDKHMEGAKIAYSNGHLIDAGAILNADPAHNSNPNMDGSWLLLRAPSAEDAKRKLFEDIYVKEGTWDPKSLQIFPIAFAPIKE